MNILLLIGSYYKYGGSEKVVTLMANDLIARHPDWTVTVAAFREACDPAKFGLSEKVPCYSLRRSRGDRPTVILRQILVDRKIDLIINHWCLPFYVTQKINKARKGLSVKLISLLHGVPDRNMKTICTEDQVEASTGIKRILARAKLAAIHAVIKASIRYVYRQSDRYLVISRGFMETFRAYTGMKEAPRLDYIYPLTDYMADAGAGRPQPSTLNPQPSTLNPQPSTLNPQPSTLKRPQILYLGRMDKENKRVNRILDAWAAVTNDYPEWNLVLVGGGPHLEALRGDAQARGIPRVTMTGFIDEKPTRYYRESSIFMLTSDLEGFGLVLVEAMSYGVVPIVYNSYVTAGEIVNDGVNGILTTAPYSHDETVKALRRLIENEEQLRAMSRAAIDKSRQFSIPSIMERWEQIIGEVMS